MALQPAPAFSETIRFNSALSLDGNPADKRIGQRHHRATLASIAAAPRLALLVWRMGAVLPFAFKPAAPF